LCRIKQAAPSCLVIVLTNSCESIFRQESQRCGADHFLHKATQFEKVSVLLNRYANQRNPQEFVLRTPALTA
jgi:DNA-binding NarL/FixJ family response regulator